LATFEAEVRVMLKPAVNDPQGLSIRGGLHLLGFEAVESVRAGKLIQVRLSATDRQAAEAAVEQMCQRLLANPVIEQYEFSLRDAPAPAA
jgi:phosphoribosylformylglycinamidine synthase subunit PurS